MKNLRRVSQGAFLLLFLFLFIQTESKGNDTLGYPVKIFLDFDPLILITTLFAAHTVEKLFFLSLGLIALSLLLGRVFCGWACPLGTLHNIVGALKKHTEKVTVEGLYRIKYLVLLFLLVSSLFSLQLVGIVDPLSFLIRSLSVSIYPAFNQAVNSFFEAIYSAGGGAEPMYRMLKKSVLSFEQPNFRQAAFIGFVFLGVLGLNLITSRFWCKYLCPLGALLGLLSRFSVLKRSVSEGCTSCGACARVCQGGAAPDKGNAWKDAECLSCWNCDDVCPQNAVSFGFRGKKHAAGLDLGRRRVMAAAASGLVAAPVLKITPHVTPLAADPLLIRPPGSREEKDFLRRCVKCGECMKVCITNGLQPTMLEAGLEGIWSPMLVPRMGYCEYRCTLCGQVCPTGAIRRLPLEEKTKVKIGLAMLDKGRCLPWAHATPCIVCEEVCPTPKKAIWLEDARVTGRNGKQVTVKQPRVDLELCIGCGICEEKCPVGGRAAIYVTSIGETRSRENKLLL
ncbi:MAG: 4Fe-4S binding protein [Thermodesulfovibrionales bacterium]